MYYLEVKLEKGKKIDNDTANFISDIIENQNDLGKKQQHSYFNNKKLIELGFIYNSSTHGFSIQKNFNINEIKKLAKEINKIENHILVHGYIQLKIYKNELYFWDKSLIYEGVDTFEYCLKYHNLLILKELRVVTKSNIINEDILNIINFTKRYSIPTNEFITQNCMWDKKEGYKIFKNLINNENEYLEIEQVINY